MWKSVLVAAAGTALVLAVDKFTGFSNAVVKAVGA